MRDKDGFVIKCIYSDWKITNEKDDKDFICCNARMKNHHQCYADEYCRYYAPEREKMSREQELIVKIREIVRNTDKEIEENPKVTYIAPLPAYFRIRELLESEGEE